MFILTDSDTGGSNTNSIIFNLPSIFLYYKFVGFK